MGDQFIIDGDVLFEIEDNISRIYVCIANERSVLQEVTRKFDAPDEGITPDLWLFQRKQLGNLMNVIQDISFEICERASCTYSTLENVIATARRAREMDGPLTAPEVNVKEVESIE